MSRPTGGKLKIARWNLAGFREIRLSQPVADLVTEAAKQASAELGEGYVYSARPGRERYRALVFAQGAEAIRHERKHQALLRYATAHGFKLTTKEK
ncbi:hypothetical protein [Corynebacterium variabile]|uniref:hypothetical protein n=1 Tax=Corynebacterium variabile TaxID=1727 RepID=UPI003FD0ADFF